jgi:tRNA(adenine34) deaminase
MDEMYMRLALQQAELAAQAGEIPVGAVVVYQDEVIAAAHNAKEKNQDSTAHAELLALQQAARTLKNWRLSGATLYCTLEPCPMCAGAMVNARLHKLVYALPDSKAGAAGSVIELLRCPGLNHQVKVISGVLAAESAKLLQSFFKNLRQ